MEIPAIYSAFKGREVLAGPVNIEGTDISFTSEPTRLQYSVDELGERMPVAVVDVRGLSKRGLDDRLLTNMRFPGSDVWFLTYIRDVEDLFDCFMGDIVKVLMPYHTPRNALVMKEAYDVSENCIPVVFVSQGMAACRDGGRRDIPSVISELSGIGFREIAVFDTDSMLGLYDWAAFNNMFPGMIPFVRSSGLPLGDAGIQRFIIDL